MERGLCVKCKVYPVFQCGFIFNNCVFVCVECKSQALAIKLVYFGKLWLTVQT